MNEIGDDILDLRDLWKNYQDLEGALEDTREEEGDKFDEDYWAAEIEEHAKLKELFEQVGEPYRGGEFDEPTLIHERHFEDYARELAEDLYGDEVRNSHWPFTCIDWEQAATELRIDYSSVEVDGHTYYQRA
jgi:Antirestriction protein (ArdA)